MARFWFWQQKGAKMRHAAGNDDSVNLHLLGEQAHLAS